LISNNNSASSSAIDLIGGTYVYIKRVLTYGFGVGIWLDQSELADIEESAFLTTSNSVAGIYLVNGAYHTPTAATMFTNRIGIRKNQFNGAGASNYVGVYDEGGYAHMIRDNNFNGGKHAVWVASGRDIVIDGNEIEGTTEEPISVNISIPNESRQEPTLNLAIQHNTMSPPDNYSSISFPTPSGGNAIAGVTVSDNVMNTTPLGPVAMGNIGGVRGLLAYSNNTLYPSTLVGQSAYGPAQLQLQGNMTISNNAGIGVPPVTPPANTFYIYVDPADGVLKAIGSSGTPRVLANP
jgi:hypothetical protein